MFLRTSFCRLQRSRRCERRCHLGSEFSGALSLTASAFTLPPNDPRLDSRDRTSLRLRRSSRPPALAHNLDTSHDAATAYAQADKFMALAKESESFDEYSIEKRGSSVRLEKQIGQFQCSFCSEETDFYDVQFEDTHWSVVPRQNMSPSGRRMTAEEVEEMERLQAAVTHLKVKFCVISTPSTRRCAGQVRPHQQGPGLQGEEHAEREPLEAKSSTIPLARPSRATKISKPSRFCRLLEGYAGPLFSICARTTRQCRHGS